MDRPIDDIVKNLLKFVVRCFYPGAYVLVLDAILFHSVLSEEDLAHLLGIKRPELRGLLTKLLEDRMLAVHSQQEFHFNTRSIKRYYYYIKYPQAIDAIKWKVHQIVSRLKDDLDKNSAPQGYMCPICQSKYSQLEAVSLLNYEKTQFLCSLCEEPLVEDDSGKKSKEKQIKLNRLMDQVQPIIDYLKKIDDSRIEENTFESSLARLIPPQNNSVASYTVNPRSKKSKMFTPGDNSNSALDNASSRRAGAKSQATLHVNITTASDEQARNEQEEKEMEEKRKQNALPAWHEQSTVGKTALGKLDGDEDVADGAQIPNGNGPEHSDDPADTQATPVAEDIPEPAPQLTQKEIEEREAERTLADYYAQLAKKQALEDEDDDGEDDEVDEGVEFEDVGSDNENEGTSPSENVTTSQEVASQVTESKAAEESSANNRKQTEEVDDDDMDAEFEDV
ncbi:transcription factor TFIIE subunit TFA1 [Lachancea thermotolerans CBS 6340]|uniref:KLTH0D06688p n=1 Tax=Lachancea thermotolerans (strain ATCC 56472 / CBS 6340 / NRRL Y-8284) TaxID=559295 RepID=C5DGN2_LACTC|nr:KLTH0D06688p [Lachancea thermotolerans CBS 6340]CAR22574.1 KLTH0D06688p [Lachancea thermotolerans CBS 6340]